MIKSGILKRRRSEQESNENLAQVPLAKSSENKPKKSFKKKVLRLLGPIGSKKRKPVTSKESLPEIAEHQRELIESHTELTTLFEPKTKQSDNESLDSTQVPEMKTSLQVAASNACQLDTIYTFPSTSEMLDSVENTNLNACEVTYINNADFQLGEFYKYLETQELEGRKTQAYSLPLNIDSKYKTQKKKPLVELTTVSPGQNTVTHRPDYETVQSSNTDSSFGIVEDKCENINSDLILVHDKINQSKYNLLKEINYSTLPKPLEDITLVQDDVNHRMTLSDYCKKILDKTKSLHNQELPEADSFFDSQNSITSNCSNHDVDLQTSHKLLQQVLTMEITKNITDITSKNMIDSKNNNHILQEIISLKTGVCVARNSSTSYTRMQNVKETSSTNILNGFNKGKNSNHCYSDEQDIKTYQNRKKENPLNHCLEKPLILNCTSSKNKTSLTSKRNCDCLMTENNVASDKMLCPWQQNVPKKCQNIIDLVDSLLSEADSPNWQNICYSNDKMKNEDYFEQLNKKSNVELKEPSQNLNLYLQLPKHNIEEITKKQYNISNVKQTNIECSTNQTCLSAENEVEYCRIVSDNFTSKCDMSNIYNNDLNTEDLCTTFSTNNQNKLYLTEETNSKNISSTDMKEQNSHITFSRLVLMQSDCESQSCDQHSNLIFSTPNFQLNLRNPPVKK